MVYVVLCNYFPRREIWVSSIIQPQLSGVNDLVNKVIHPFCLPLS